MLSLPPVGVDLPELVVLPKQATDIKLYNCFRHYVLPSDSPKGSMIRVKALRIPDIFPEQRSLEKLEPLLGTGWRALQGHSNIAATRFCRAVELGLPDVQSLSMVLVMSEYKNGNILEYIHRVDASYAERIKWLQQITNALESLHIMGIVHGNLHVNNILINDKKNALLADAAIYTSVLRHFVPEESLRRIRFPVSLACKSAELIVQSELLPTTPMVHHDIFALVVTIWTVLSGKEPFEMYGQTWQSIQLIAQKDHQNLPKVDGMSEGLWTLLHRVMSQPPVETWPTLNEIKSELRVP